MVSSVSVSTDFEDPKGWKTHHFGVPKDRWSSLKDKNFWITGGGTGYGQSMSIALAAAKAQIFITGRRREKLQETITKLDSMGVSTEKCHILVADLTKEEELISACQKIARLCESLNGLINNAALPNRPGTTKPLQEDPLAYWNKLMATNVTGPWILTRSIFRHLIKSGQPRILFIGSGAGWAATPGIGPYNVSKAALNSLSQNLAMEFSRDFPESDVQVNLLAAGEALTEMNQGSKISPNVIIRMALILLSQPKDGPNGCFFSAEGDHLGFGETLPYQKPLIQVKRQYEGHITSRWEAQLS